MKKRLRGLLALVLAFVTFFTGMPMETQAAGTGIPTLYAYKNEGDIATDADNPLSDFETHQNAAIGTEMQTLSPYSGWSEDQKDNIGGWKLWNVSSANGNTIHVTSGLISNLYGRDAVITENAVSNLYYDTAAVGVVMLEEPAIMGNGAALSTDWYRSPVRVYASYSGGNYYVSTTPPQYESGYLNTSNLAYYVDFDSSVSNQTLYFIRYDGFYIGRNISLNIDYTQPTVTVAVSDGESGEGIDTNMNPNSTGLIVNATDAESGVAKYYVYYGTEDWSTKSSEEVKHDGTETTSASINLTSLAYNTTYYYAVVAEDVAGNLSTVASGTFTTEEEALAGTVTISGAYGETEPYEYGDVLRANVNITAPANAGEITYTWYRGDDEVTSGTTSTYTIGSDDIGKIIWCKVTAANAKGSIASEQYTIGKATLGDWSKAWNVVVDDTYGIDKITFSGVEFGAPYEYRTREDATAEWSNWNDCAWSDDGLGCGNINCSIVIGNVNRGIGDIQIRPKESATFAPTEASVYTNEAPFTAVLKESVALSGDAVYGGTLTADVTLGSFPDGNPTLLYTFKRGTEEIQAASATNTYQLTKADVGKQITVEVTAADSFNVAGTLTATSEVVQKKSLTITGATVTEREYDGTTDANVESVTLSGMVSTDTLTMGTDFTVVSANYDYPYAGTDRNVEIEIALQGEVADCYTLSSDTYTLTNQTIQKKSITLSNATLKIDNGLAKTYEYDLEQLLPAGGSYDNSGFDVGTIDLPSDYYSNGAYSEYATLYVPILNAVSKSGEIGTIQITFEDFNYKATSGGVITVVAIQENITGIDVPGDVTLTDHKASANDVIQSTGILPAGVTVFTERTYPTGTQMPINWSCDNYNTAPEAENTFIWTVDSNAYAAFATNGFAMTGRITVKNPAALPVSHDSTMDEITYDGSTYDVRDLFRLDSNAGTATYSITGGTGEGTLGADGYTLTITKAGSFEIKADTAATGIYAAGSAYAELNVNKGIGLATVTMADFTYGETASEPVTISTTNTGVTATISYKVAGAADSTYTTTKPVNAGSYVVRAEYAATDLYNAVSVTDDFVIHKAVISDVSTTLSGVIAPVAGEAPQNTLSVAAGEGYSAAISWDINSSVYEYDTEYTATVVFTADANHKFADTVTMGGFTKVSGSESALTVSKSYATLKEKITAVEDLQNQVMANHYTDAAAVIAANILPATVKVQTETNTTGIDMTVEWGFTGSYDTEPNAENTFSWAVNASEYAAYDLNGHAMSGTIIVTNAPAVAVTNTGADDTITYTVATYEVSDMFVLDTNAGTVTYSITGGTGTGTLNGSVLTITKAGTFEIKADTAAAGIYAAGSAQATLTVELGTGAATITMDDYTYGETASEPVTSSTTNTGVTATISYKVAGTADSTYTTTKPVNAGSYIVRAEYAATDLYNAVTVTDTFEIEKSEITDVTSTLAGVIAPVAGEAPQSTLSVAAGVGYSAVISWTPAVTAYDYDTEYTANVVFTADANYKFADTVAMGGFTKVSGSESALTVSKSYETAKEKLTGVGTLANQALTVHYADAAAVIAANVLPATVKVQTETNTTGIDMTVEWSFTGSYNTAPEAENTFAWAVKADEYAAYDVNGQILDGTITVTNAEALEVTNTGADDNITYTGGTYAVSDMFVLDTNAGTVTYSITGGTGTGTLNGSVLTITKAGTFEIKADTAAAGIYAAGSATAELTVNKGVGVATITMADYTYGETASVATTSSTTNTDVTAIISYKVAGTADSTYTTTQPVNAGSYIVRAEYAATDLYDAVSVTDDFVIHKAVISDVSTTLNGIIAPVAGEAPQSTLSVAVGAGYSVAMRWNPDVAKYAYATEYTATVVLTADSNHKFADTVAMGDFSKVSGSESTLTVSKSYETLKEKVTGVGTLANQTLIVQYADAAAVIAANVLPATVKVQTETNTVGIDMAVEWSFTGSYNTASEAENTFTWTVKETEYAAYDVNGHTMSGNITVTNVKKQVDERKPFIKGQPHKSGWDVINAEMNYIKEGGTIVVDMNGTTMVPGYILEQIRAKKITLTIEMFPGVSWTIDGNKVEPGTRSSVDMGVKIGTLENPLNNIPSNILNKLVGNRKYITASLAHDGTFGFEAILNIGLNAENAGMYATLFYYNEQYGVMQFICADDIDQYGAAHLVLTHASEYAIVLDAAVVQNSITSPKTGDENDSLRICLMMLALLSLGTGSYMTIKKRKRV